MSKVEGYADQCYKPYREVESPLRIAEKGIAEESEEHGEGDVGEVVCRGFGHINTPFLLKSTL
jgi:hypothetical protein